MRTPENVLKIGVLNLMHDKLDTKRRFERILKNSAQPVELTFFILKITTKIGQFQLKSHRPHAHLS